MDAECFSKIEEMAYLYLAIHCDKCDEDFEIGSEASEPIENWAKAATDDAVAAGWGCSGGVILCPNCVKSK